MNQSRIAFIFLALLTVGSIAATSAFISTYADSPFKDNPSDDNNGDGNDPNGHAPGQTNNPNPSK